MQNYEKLSAEQNIVSTAQVSFKAQPLINFITEYADLKGLEPDVRLLTNILAEIGQGLNCDRENEIDLFTEANSALWSLHRLFSNMAITDIKP